MRIAIPLNAVSSSQVIICDEISTSEEVEAVRSIAQRGVRIIATVHGSTLPELVGRCCLDLYASIKGLARG